jgi:hypothetical protein
MNRPLRIASRVSLQLLEGCRDRLERDDRSVPTGVAKTIAELSDMCADIEDAIDSLCAEAGDDINGQWIRLPKIGRTRGVAGSLAP